MDSKYITIFGSYNSGSIGDKAILVSLLDLLFRVADFPIKINVVAFNPEAIEAEIKVFPWSPSVYVRSIFLITQENNEQRPPNKKKIYTSKILKWIPGRFKDKLKNMLFLLSVNNRLHKDLADKSDLLIIGGGNLLMDLYTRWPVYPYLVAKQFIEQKKPFAIAGVGAFPIKTRMGKFLLKRLVEFAGTSVFVRDTETEKYIISTWGLQAHYHPDFAFSYPSETFNAMRQKDKKVVAVNVAPVFGSNWPYRDRTKYKNFIEGFVENLFYLQTSIDEKVNLFFFDTNYPTDRLGTLEVIERLKVLGIEKESLLYEDRIYHSQEIIKKLNFADFTIATRLHAGLLALKSGSPILAVSYQPKVKNIMNDIDMPECVVDTRDIGNFRSKIDQIRQKPQNFRLSKARLSTLDCDNIKVIKQILSLLG